MSRVLYEAREREPGFPRIPFPALFANLGANLGVSKTSASPSPSSSANWAAKL